MKKKVQQITFNNKRKESQFDIISLKNLFERTDLEHSLVEFQQVNFYMLLLFVEGEGKHTIDFTEFSYKKETILSIRKDQIHKFHKSDSDGYILLFTDEFLIQFFEKKEVQKSLQLFNEYLTSPKTQVPSIHFLEIISYVNKIKHEYFTINDHHSFGVIRSMLHIIFSTISRLKSYKTNHLSENKTLNQFIKFQALVEEQCFHTKKVMDFANQMAVSTKTINNITHKIIHKSAKQFINEIVITQIKRLLINTELSVKEIAYTAGFEEPTHLFKFFKKYTDKTPECFRKNNK